MQRRWTALLPLVLAATAAGAAPTTLVPGPRSHDTLVAPRAGKPVARTARKLGSRLRHAGAGTPLASALVPTQPPRSADGTLRVTLACDATGAEQLAALAAAGASVEAVDAAAKLVQARVPDTGLDRVAAFGWVRAVRAVDLPVVRAVTSEGVAGARADAVLAQGLDGDGIVVGVISDGIDSLRDAQRDGELPEVVVPDDPRCRRGSGDEGTALLEIVHDVAPGARLLFAGPGSSVEMAEAVQCLAAAGADVIVDDLGFFGEPYFADGPVAAAVRAAVAAGVSYHSSAGNEAEEHLEQDFVATPGSTLHDFGAGTRDNTNAIAVPPGGTLTCILQWDNPFGAAADDYDLLLFDAGLNLVTSSTDVQDGTQDPIELVEVVNQSDAVQIANVAVNRFAGPPRRLEMFCLGGGTPEHTTPGGSIVGHPALAEVVAVGAIDAADPGLDDVEPFSSRGPAEIAFPRRERRQKPDVAALDGVTISNAGGFPSCPPACAFFGTSAAAPHSAGVAALLLQKDPSLTPAALQRVLRESATDIEVLGVDDASGSGRLDALAAAAAVAAPSQPTDPEPPADPGAPSDPEPPADPESPVDPDEPPPPACLEDAECDDGDACTADVCVPEAGCVSTALGGAAELACRLGALRAPGVCAAGALDARTRGVISRRTAKALALLARLGGTPPPRKPATLVERLVQHLDALQARIEKGADRGTIDADCADTLTTLLDESLALADELAG